MPRRERYRPYLAGYRANTSRCAATVSSMSRAIVAARCVRRAAAW